MAGDGSSLIDDNFHAAPTEENFYRILGSAETDGHLERGAKVKLGELRRTDGTTVSFVLAEGAFSVSSIEPAATWKTLLVAPTILVSSADEQLRNDGGISLSIGQGCDLSKPGYEAATGAVVWSPCKGSYKKAFPQIEWVGSAIIKAWNGVGEMPTCDLQHATRSQKSYPKCIQYAVESALWNIFRSSEVKPIHIMVLPELGTGTAQVEKEYFYSAVTNAFKECLISTKACDRRIPENIIFSVWSGDTANAWNDTRSAAAKQLALLAASWKDPYNAARLDSDALHTKAARFLGILLLLLIYVCLPLYSRFLPRFIMELLPPESPSSLSIFVLGWALVAIGTIEVLSGFLSSIDLNPVEGFVPNLTLGIAAAAVCGLFHKATKVFGD